MKIASVVLLLLAFSVTCTYAAEPPKGITASDIAGKPSVFCKVNKEPDPQLMGRWKCLWERFIPKAGKTDPNPIEYYLAKYGDQYALYFFRSKEGGERIYSSWRDFTIDGNTIKSDTGVKIFTQNGEVFFQFQSDAPVKMTKVEGN